MDDLPMNEADGRALATFNGALNEHERQLGMERDYAVRAARYRGVPVPKVNDPLAAALVRNSLEGRLLHAAWGGRLSTAECQRIFEQLECPCSHVYQVWGSLALAHTRFLINRGERELANAILRNLRQALAGSPTPMDRDPDIVQEVAEQITECEGQQGSD